MLLLKLKMKHKKTKKKFSFLRFLKLLAFILIPVFVFFIFNYIYVQKKMNQVLRSSNEVNNEIIKKMSGFLDEEDKYRKQVMSEKEAERQRIYNVDLNTSSWTVYKNDKYGFMLKYPSNLKLIPLEVDIKKNHNDYLKKCKTGVLNSCIGSRWPDFKISFFRENGKVAFDVRIYQVAEEAFGGVVKDNFQFWVNNFHIAEEDGILEPVDIELLKQIAGTLDFFEPQKPLICYWSDEYVGFNKEVDKDYIKENEDKLIEASGVFFNQQANSCWKTSYYVWKNRIEKDSPPFKNLEECQAALCYN